MPLTIRQKKAMNFHKKYHTAKHMKAMTVEMKKGKTFTEAHKIATKKVGQ
tara:strand:+ start:67 stop:216 length:150 start_codon:yes stop_codon:yes gene_type:complete